MKNYLYLIDDDNEKLINKSQFVIKDGFEEEYYREQSLLNVKGDRISRIFSCYDEVNYLMGIFYSFSKSNTNDNENGEQNIKKFEEVKEMVKKLYNSNLDLDTKQYIIKSLYPNFGYLATEFFNYLKVDIIKQYNLDLINKIYNESINNDLEVSDEIMKVINNLDNAKDNTKVLNLAKDVYYNSRRTI